MLWVTAIEEVLRYYAPVTMGRQVISDTEVAGCPVRAGEQTLVTFPAANHDPEAFEAAGEFQIDRALNRHVAFGYGPHVCVGQHLAKMEMRLLWEELLPRLSSLELTAPPELTRSNFVCGPKHVRVRFGVQ